MTQLTATPDRSQITQAVLRCLGDASAGDDVEEFEGKVAGLLMAVGRDVLERRLSEFSEQVAFKDGGTTWKPVVESNKSVMTCFGKISVERPLFRAVPNGPTRCLVSERAGLIRGFWTPRAARVAAIASAELPLARAEQFFAELGGLTPSAATLQRLNVYLSELWEERREEHEQAVRESAPIPEQAVAASVSLDGVMVNMLESGAERRDRKAQTRAQGKADRGPAGYKEASVGVISFYDEAGERLATRRIGRMPESDKKATKAWLEAEVAAIRFSRPDLKLVGTADGTPNNWSFLSALELDYEVVDYFHTTEHVHRHLSKANGASSLDTQAKFREMKGALLEEEGGARKVFSELRSLRHEAGTAPVHKKKKRQPETPDKRRMDYFDHHHARMDYSRLRALKLPIGSGVTEGTCRHLVVDRLRRSGMRWGQEGGQAVLTLRAQWLNGDFPAAWQVLRGAVRRRVA